MKKIMLMLMVLMGVSSFAQADNDTSMHPMMQNATPAAPNGNTTCACADGTAPACKDGSQATVTTPVDPGVQAPPAANGGTDSGDSSDDDAGNGE